MRGTPGWIRRIRLPGLAFCRRSCGVPGCWWRSWSRRRDSLTAAPALRRRREELRFGRRRKRPQAALPPTDVVPGAHLEADVAIDTDRLEANGLVQRDARRIWQCDAGKRLEVSEPH